MNNKKISFAFLAILMVSVFATTLVSAVPVSGNGVTNFLKGVANVASPITLFLFGQGKSTGEGGFVALMAFILTLLVIAGIITSMKIFGDKAGINWAISAIVALIGVRFISVDALKAFTLGSQGLVGALFLIVPFVVVATLILRANSEAVRKILWVVYAAVMAALLAYNWGASPAWSSFYFVYLGIIGICIVLFLMDGTIQRFFRKADFERQISGSEDNQIYIAEGEIKELNEALARIEGDDSAAKTRRKAIEKAIDSKRINIERLQARKKLS
jgi:hypothetical protein